MSTTKYMNSHSPAASVKSKPEERGFALLLTIFGLLLLTAVVTAMMFSSDSETTIAVNYRDAQSASYSATSGLLEARDRIQPVFGDLATAGFVPTQIPDGVGGKILYIVNPNVANNETVASIAPWKAKINGVTNPYFDQELCQEKMLGIAAGVPGVACSPAAGDLAASCPAVGGAGVGWCTSYDNSNHATNWQLKDANGNPIPLDYKWVRISLKEDWNTLVYVPSPAAASGQQVCWDGNYQTQIPAGYGTNCQPGAGFQVIGLNVTAAGSGYTSAPIVTITGGGGSGATATAQISPAPADGIVSVVLTNGGSGYTSPPTVSISPTGATFQAIVNTSSVTGVNVNSASTNYCYAITPTAVVPTVNFSTNPTSNTLLPASATVNMNNNAGCIASISKTGSCNHTTSGNAYPIKTGGPGGGGSGFSGNVFFGSGNSVSAITVVNPGTGYTPGTTTSTITITNDQGNPCSIPNVSFTSGAQISSISVTNGGAYMVQPTATLGGSAPAAPSAPVLPTLAALPNPWPANPAAISNVQVTSAGSGYTPGVHYPLTFTGGGGTGAAGYAVGGGTDIVSGFTITNGGSGYTSAPTVLIVGGGGTGASATATIAAGNVSTSMGQIYMLTSMAVTKTGTKAMAQMEAAARPPFNFNLGGAITLAGPEPTNDFTSPNSANLTVNGSDANSCGQTAASTKPAIGVYDNPSQNNVISALGKPANYTGAGGTPSIENVYTAIGGASATPSALDGFVADMSANATTLVNGNASSLPSTTTSSVTVINGNLTLSGNPSGSGILIVTGTLTFSGNFTWNGLVLIIGQGIVVHNGGGNGNINGAIYVAQTKDTSGNELSQLGNPQFTWNGGGTNSVAYDHCLSDNLLKKYVGQPSGLPLQVLSTRLLEF